MTRQSRLEAAVVAAAVLLPEGAGAQPSTSSRPRSSSPAPTPRPCVGSSRPRRDRPLPAGHAEAGRRARRDGADRRTEAEERRRRARRPRAGARAARARRAPPARCRRPRRRSGPKPPGPAGTRSSRPTGTCSARAASRSSAAPSRPSASSCSSCSPRTAAGSRPAMRVAFGACVSAAAVGVGVLGAVALRPAADVARRRGRGIAGGYATLAAAAARYDLVPGLARAPARGRARGRRRRDRDRLVVGDRRGDRAAGSGSRPCPAGDRHGADLASAAFAVIIFAATVALAVPRRWHTLLVGIAVVVGAQVRVLALDADAAAGAGTTAVLASFVLVVLAAGIWLQLVSGRDGSRSARELVRARRSGPRAPARPAPVGRRPQPGLRARRGGRGLGRCWIALRRSARPRARARRLLSFARRRRDRRPAVGNEPRYHLGRRGAAPVLHRLAGPRRAAAGNRPRVLRHHRGACAPGRCPAEAGVRGARSRASRRLRRRSRARPSRCRASSPRRAVARTESGLLAWLAPVRDLARSAPRRAAGGPRPRWCRGRHLRGAILLIAHSFRPGHLAATILAATVGAAAVRSRRGAAPSSSSRRRSPGSAACLRSRTGFDVPRLRRRRVHRSYGGWALSPPRPGCSPAPSPSSSSSGRSPSPLPGGGGLLALAAAAAGLALISPADGAQSSWIGWRLLVPTLLPASRRACSAFRVIAISQRSCGRSVSRAPRQRVARGRDATWRAVAFAVARPSATSSRVPCGSSGSGSPAGASVPGRRW